MICSWMFSCLVGCFKEDGIKGEAPLDDHFVRISFRKILDLEDFFFGPITLPQTNMAPETGWLEDEFPFGMAYFQGLC